MGFKIEKRFLVVILFFLAACGSPSFDDIEGPDIFYQISPGEKNILRVRYTIDKGAPSIQLFDTKGNFLKDNTIVPASRMLMTASKEDSIRITYFVGQSDLDMFLPWFNTNKYNANRIDNYTINYNYEIHNTYLENKGSEIDSLGVEAKGQITSLYLNGKLIVKEPTHLFVVKLSKFMLYNPLSQSYTSYTFKNKSLVKDYLEKILAAYN